MGRVSARLCWEVVLMIRAEDLFLPICPFEQVRKVFTLCLASLLAFLTVPFPQVLWSFLIP